MRNVIIALSVMSLTITACTQLSASSAERTSHTAPKTQPPTIVQPEAANQPVSTPPTNPQPEQQPADKTPTPSNGPKSTRPPQETANRENKGRSPSAAPMVVEASQLHDIRVLVNKQIELPPDYVPHDLVKPAVPFADEGDNPKHYMRKEAAEALEKLFNQARQEGIELVAVSGYRSYDRQKAIFEWNAKQEGEEKANQTSAKPGQSEHQTGLAMDVSCRQLNYALTESFANTPEGKWLAQNAPSFGFIIRYPKGKEHITGYAYEPWHIRYVGVEAAAEISSKGLTLEEYLLGVPASPER